ncbi:MAG: DUF6934 family protein [Segetibacter sp.]
MKLPKYHLKAESRFTRFEFIREGPKGVIRKQIEFQATTDFDVYNLAFGDKDPLTGDINDLAVSNNGDTEKVLATIIAALYVFLDNYPAAYNLRNWKYRSTDKIIQNGHNQIL